MARVPDEEIERLKREVSVLRLAAARGVELKRHGVDLIGQCPFHDDRQPSFVVSPKKNLWHCLGACQAGGTSIDFVMKAEGVSFRHAVELMRADVPVSSNGNKPRKVSTVPKLPSPVDPEASGAQLLGQVIDYYHETLKQSPEALAYLEERGLRSSEVVERFRLGFANRTLGFRLPQANRVAGQKIRERLYEVGMYISSVRCAFSAQTVTTGGDETALESTGWSSFESSWLCFWPRPRPRPTSRSRRRHAGLCRKTASGPKKSKTTPSPGSSRV